jgi:hypothetical protein
MRGYGAARVEDLRFTIYALGVGNGAAEVGITGLAFGKYGSRRILTSRALVLVPLLPDQPDASCEHDEAGKDGNFDQNIDRIHLLTRACVHERPTNPSIHPDLARHHPSSTIHHPSRVYRCNPL